MNSIIKFLYKVKKAMRQEIRKKIFYFLRDFPGRITDTALHQYAEQLGLDPDELEEELYNFFADFIRGGLSKGKTVKVDPEELKMGIAVEMEHTPCEILAQKIAIDHLVENPKYYSMLKEFENSWKK